MQRVSLQDWLGGLHLSLICSYKVMEDFQATFCTQKWCFKRSLTWDRFLGDNSQGKVPHSQHTLKNWTRLCPPLAQDLNLSSTNTQGTEYTENLLLFSQKQPLFFSRRSSQSDHIVLERNQRHCSVGLHPFVFTRSALLGHFPRNHQGWMYERGLHYHSLTFTPPCDTTCGCFWLIHDQSNSIWI